MGVMDRDRCIKVSGLLGSIVFSQTLLAETTACPKRTTALKAHTSLFLLAEARVRRKASFLVISARLAIFMGSKGGLIRRLRTIMRSHLGATLCCTGQSMAKFLTSMLRSRSWEISIPLARKTLDMQDLYPCIEDIASFFSSNRKTRKSDNCWTVALTGLICLTWQHSLNTFHLDS